MIDLPDWSNATLAWINAGLLLLWLPLGFTGWAFAAGGVAIGRVNSLRWVARGMFVPLVLLLAALTGSWWLPASAARALAWTPIVLAGATFAVFFLLAFVSGFVSGARKERGAARRAGEPSERPPA